MSILETGTDPFQPLSSGADGDGAMRAFMAETRRELALFASEMMGAQSYVGQFGTEIGPMQLGRKRQRLFRELVEETPHLYMVIDPRPGLHIVEVNAAYAAATITDAARVAGNRLFDVFPDNPGLPDADGVSNLFESLQRAAQSGHTHAMQVQRYDVRDRQGNFVERHWQPRNTPIFDGAGRLIFLLHQAFEVPARDVR